MSNTFESRGDTLSHGAWKKHKYIRKEGKKYIYKESTKHDDGTVWDKYVAEDGSAIHKQAGYKYDPKRPDYRKGVIEKAKEVASKITDKENSEGEMAKGDYVDEEEEKKKYFVKHSDNSLAHSLRGSQRANHKYSARKWVNGKWRYFYGKARSAGKAVIGTAANAIDDVGRPKTSSGGYITDRGPKAMYDYYVTGEGYKKRANSKNWTGDKDAIRREVAAAQKDYKEKSLAGRLGVGERDRYYAAQDKYLSNRNSNRSDIEKRGLRDTAHAAKQQYDKTPLGKIESTANKGAAILKNFFKNSSKTKATVKDTFTGKTRTPKQTGDDVINIKELSEKNKKKNTNKKVKYLKDGSKVTIETSTYSRRPR